jgi:threonylcarbamoyladenosine tRNA methylthiotransferase MtaB
MSTFSVRFLGCKVSQADAMLIRDALRDAGHVEADPDTADVHVVNTCALTVEAERKSRQQVNRAARVAARTFVTGCAANLNRDQFADEGVTVVNGSADRVAIEIVHGLGPARPQACHDDERPAGRTRAFVKVQNGCDQRCAFCIIPSTRGGAASRARELILRDARRRVADGHPEIVLTGINIGTWRDPAGRGDLADLVREIGRLDGLARLRISSIEPGDVTPRLVEAMVDTARVADHMHIPLQSADPAVLAEMGRSYTIERYRQAVEWAREGLPRLNVTTDVIVGFPTETDTAFARTVEVARELGFGKIHVFPYSPRPGTRAEALGDLVAPDAKSERSRVLRDLSDRLGFAHRHRRIGTADAVLIEKPLADGRLTGYGSDYTRFVLAEGSGATGELVPVVAEALAGEHLLGVPMHKERDRG